MSCRALQQDRVLPAAETQYVRSARVGRLATADGRERPHAVPVCFALVDDRIVVALDEKPKEAKPTDLRRVRDIEANPHVALVVDHYTEEWDDLGWVQVRGQASLLDPGEKGHAEAAAALRSKYTQYYEHDLESRPLVRIVPGHAVSWGTLEHGGR